MLKTIHRSIVDGYVTATTRAIERALESGCGPQEIIDGAMVPAMAEMGSLFEHQTCFVPEILLAARAMKEGLAVLKPHLVAAQYQPLGRIVLGTVEGDIHDIGKNLVGMMFSGAGFEVIDLGVDVPPQRFVEAVQLHQPAFVGLSVLLSTGLPAMQRTIETLHDNLLCPPVRIIVGGTPLTAQVARQIGADLYAPDATAAAHLLRDLVTQEICT